ncbi:DUF1349 domain-containing protein [Geodermatophilus sp. SYSU D01186]
MPRQDWSSGAWLNEPLHHIDALGRLVVKTRDGSDFWRQTSYGFTRDSGHALLWPLPPGSAVEVSFVGDLTQLYDQAGILVRVDEATWTKAGLEFTDGAAHLGAVVTRAVSDWSTSPVPTWSGREVTLRVSRAGDAITIRARVEHEPWIMIRLAPLDAGADAFAGPYCCSPERGGFEVTFTGASTGPADPGLHQPPD